MSNFCQGADSGENLIWDHKSCSQRWFCKLMTICLMIKTCCQEWKWSRQSSLYLSNNQIYRMQNLKGNGWFSIVYAIPGIETQHADERIASFTALSTIWGPLYVAVVKVQNYILKQPVCSQIICTLFPKEIQSGLHWETRANRQQC